MKLIDNDEYVHGKSYLIYRNSDSHKGLSFFEYKGIFTHAEKRVSNDYVEGRCIRTRQRITLGECNDRTAIYELDDDETFNCIMMDKILESL